MSIPKETLKRLRSKLNKKLKQYKEPVAKSIRQQPITEISKTKTRKEVCICKDGTKNRFLISAVVEGAPIVWPFVEAMENYAKLNNAELVLLWMRGVYKKDIFTPFELNKIQRYITTKIKLNSNLIAQDFELAPAKCYPLGGRITQLGTKDMSVIVASTKQHMEVIPCSPDKIPHCMWSTGTISTPKYSETEVGSLAKQENTVGGLIVELQDNKRFVVRPIQWIGDGFVDLGYKYTKNKKQQVKTKAMVFGDIHFGEEDNDALNTAIEQAKTLKTEKIFLHDIGSFNSISHHLIDKCVSRAILPTHLNTLEKELDYVKTSLHSLVSKFNREKTDFYVVNSNHDNFLKRYLESGAFVSEPSNAIKGAEMFLDLCKGKHLLEEQFRAPHIHFLKKYESMKVEGIEMAIHGHEGASGGRGSTSVFFKHMDRCIIGHQHKPGIRGGCYIVGTLSKLKLPYMSGLSGWLHANAVVYEGGYVQLLVYVDNNWHN